MLIMAAFATALHAAPGLRGMAWGAIVSLLCSILPFAFVYRGVRRGRYVNRTVPCRKQRLLPMCIGLGGMAAAFALLVAIPSAPRELLALVLILLVGLVATLGITLRWMISVNTVIAGGTCTVLYFVYGPALLLVTPLVAVTAWSRLALEHHTRSQLIAGATLGTFVAVAVFTLLH
ncbi:hypothetical protein ACIRPT_02520 [Streptomyces sp. NPDC101227]|uniref:hypothetical protein n=1 Tax=Streptomyces sp. NPDC101227 TaxID=3366136 RepID=UPI0037F1A0F2